jgi:hypothetical protein
MRYRGLTIGIVAALFLSLAAPSAQAKIAKTKVRTTLVSPATKRKAPARKGKPTLSSRLQAFKAEKAQAFKSHIPKLRSDWKDAITRYATRAAPFARGFARVALIAGGTYLFYKGGTSITEQWVNAKNIFDPIGLAYVGSGMYLKMMSTMPKADFGKRLKLGLLGAHETKLALALAVYSSDPTMTAGALILAGHGLVKLRHTLNKKAPPPAGH